MRSQLAQTLPPNSALQITIDPPIALDERPFLLTVHGPSSVSVEIQDDRRVIVRNNLPTTVPFFFFVGPQVQAPPWLEAGLAFVKQLRGQ